MKMKRFLLTSTYLILALVFCLLLTGVPQRVYASHGSGNAPWGAIQGIVKDAGGSPIAGIGVGAGDFAPMLNCGPAGYWTTTAADGSYTLLVPGGNYLVFVNSHNRPEGYIPEAYPNVHSWAKIQNALPVIVDIGQTVPGINFNLPNGFGVYGRLVDTASQPMLGAGGHLEDPDQKVEFGCALGNGSSDLDGTFRFNVPAGIYNLDFCANSQCLIVIKGKIIGASTSLGNVIFNEAPDPPQIFNPQTVLPGYNVESYVPGGPNTPSDVTVTANGKIYLAAVRSWKIYEVSPGGVLKTLAPLGVYTLEAAADGNIYGYFFPGYPGLVFRITPAGAVTSIGSLPQTSCESTLTVAPNLDIWIGYNACVGTGYSGDRLYRMSQGGSVYTVTTSSGYINALDFDTSGKLFMTSDGALYRVNTSDGSRTLIARLPQLTSFHGLVAASDGNFYISTNSSDPGPGNHDRIYKVTPQGAVSILAELPASCLQGLAQESDGDLLGTMRCSGALYRVHLNGSWETLLPGNGMATPQAMAFNLEGELLVNNDESGRIVKITHGGGAFFAQVISFIPPYGFFAYLPSGDFYFSEAAPGFEPRLSRISPTGQVTQVTKQLNFPSGLAFDTTGNLFAVENLSGKISRVSPNGTINPFINNLTRPQALVSDGLGYLYVGDYDGPLQNPDDPAENPTSNRIWKVDLQGNRTLIASHDLQTMTISPAKELYITGSVGYYRGVLRVNPDGSLTPLAIGFLNPVGLAFDVAGNLYVSDDIDNSITRITGFPHGLLQGRISSASTHAPIQGAAISVVTRYPMVLGERTISDSAGDYQLTVAQGQYNLTATAAGFCAKTVQDVIVYAGNLNDVHLALEPCPRLFLPRLLKRY